MIAFLLCLFVGIFGVHYFYVGKIGMGIYRSCGLIKKIFSKLKKVLDFFSKECL